MRPPAFLMSWGLFFFLLYNLPGSSKSEAFPRGKVSQELRVTTVPAGGLTSWVNSMGLVIELGPIDSPVIIRQILGDSAGPRTEWEAQPACQD